MSTRFLRLSSYSSSALSPSALLRLSDTKMCSGSQGVQGQIGPQCPTGPKGYEGHPGISTGIYSGVFRDFDTVFEVTCNPNHSDLCNPEFEPIFVCYIANEFGRTECVVIVVPGDPDKFYRADPRLTDLKRTWTPGKQFPTHLPVFNGVKPLGRNNRFFRQAKSMVDEWMKTQFTSLQTEVQPAQSAG